MPAARISSGDQQPKRRRVTHKASEAASFAQPPLSSNTAMFLAYKWDCGEYSAQKVQRIAALVKADILTAIESSSGCSVQNEKKNETSGFADLDALARLGLKGRFPKKYDRELEKLMWKDAVRDEFKENTFKDAFRDELEKFWNAMEDRLHLKDNPVLYRKDWKRHAMPVVLHDDGVPLTGIGKSFGKLMDRLNRLERRIDNCSSYEVDTIIQVRVCFDKFRSTADFSEVHEAMQEQYESAIHKLETGTSLKPGKRHVKSEPSESETTNKQPLEVFKSEPSGSETTEKQWLEVSNFGGARST